ncbi:MAG: hypothetical protein K6U11_06375 [bacterium]|nr:hypothetical protein [bacterium]
MYNSDTRKMREVFIAELINALEEELEFEHPFIPEDEKKLLVQYMLQDIFQREGYLFDLSATDCYSRIKLLTQENTKVVFH